MSLATSMVVLLLGMQRCTRAAFLEVYPYVKTVVSDYFIRQLPACPERATSWVESVLDYNVPHGKLKRGLTVVHAFQCLKPQASETDTTAAVRLGWALELLQACFLMADDIMDSSLTRRGRPCWYKLPTVGMDAVNDALLLENSIYLLVSDSLSDVVLRRTVLDIIAEAKLNTLLGQRLDSEAKPLRDCTPELYSNVVRLKTSHYSFYLPVAVALTLAGGNVVDAPSELRQLCYDMGYYFQAQDDYLDCFGDSAVTGKVGTDIQDGKCTWLLIKALECIQRNGRDWDSLMDNYGKSDHTNVDAVKNLYTSLGLERKYELFEVEEFDTLKNNIDRLPIFSLRPLFMELLADMLGRRK